MTRTVLLHYHLFKNAGTSLDVVLKRNFGDAWITREFERRPRPEHRQELTQWILDNPQATAFSSHTMEALPPNTPSLRIIPLVFVRQPLDRIASAYNFERKQNIERLGPVIASNTSLAGYVRIRMALPNDKACRNFQTHRLAILAKGPGKDLSVLERASSAVQSLPFIGIVESFDESMERLTKLLRPTFPQFKPHSVQANVSARPEPGLGLAQKLAKLQQELGPQVYAQLEAANAQDLALYQLALERVATQAS